MNLKGQICDGCKKTMEEREDIVVCPVCGTPQHRVCWEEHGECVNAAKHAEGFIWQPDDVENDAQAQVETVKCPFCGKDNPKNALTCVSCGAPLTNHNGGNNPQSRFQSFFNNVNAPANPFLFGVKDDPDSEIDGVKVSDIACFVQNGVPKYIDKFKKLQKDAKGKKKISFNWAAFFFAPIWFFYRKLWKVGLIFASILLAITLAFTTIASDFAYANQAYAEAFLEADQKNITQEELDKKAQAFVDATKKMAPMFALNILLAVAAGFVADPIYKKYTFKRINSIKENSNSQREFEAVTLTKGGTSFLFAFIGYFGYNIIYKLLLSLAMLL